MTISTQVSDSIVKSKLANLIAETRFRSYHRCQEIHAQKLQSVKNVLNITGQQERIESQIVSFRTQRKRNNDFQIKSTSKGIENWPII